jgi:hypothetical protein
MVTERQLKALQAVKNITKIVFGNCLAVEQHNTTLVIKPKEKERG